MFVEDMRRRGQVDLAAVNEFIAETAGFPVDAVNFALSAIGLDSKEPVFGSDWFKAKLRDWAGIEADTGRLNLTPDERRRVAVIQVLFDAITGIGGAVKAGGKRVIKKGQSGRKKNKTDTNLTAPPDHDLSRKALRRELKLSPEWSRHRRANPNRPVVGRDPHVGRPADIGPDALPSYVGDPRLAVRNGEYGALDRHGTFFVPKLPAQHRLVRVHPDGGRTYRYEIDGREHFVYFNRYRQPEFEPKAVVWLHPDDVAKGYKEHREYFLSQLRTMTPSQLQAMGIGEPAIKKLKEGATLLPDGRALTLRNLGFAVHHDYRVGRLVLVDLELHKKVKHEGGMKLWGMR